LKEDLDKSAGFLVIQAPDWADPDWSPLRQKLRDMNVQTRKVKNTLMRIALETSPFRALMPVFVGPNSVLFYPNVETGIKLLGVLQKQQHCVMFAGTLGNTILDAEDLKMLARSPSRERVLAELVAVLQSAPAGLAAALSSPAFAIARAVHQMSLLENKESA
jgi:large subunit ribosomal protein L10